MKYYYLIGKYHEGTYDDFMKEDNYSVVVFEQDKKIFDRDIGYHLNGSEYDFKYSDCKQGIYENGFDDVDICQVKEFFKRDLEDLETIRQYQLKKVEEEYENNIAKLNDLS